MKLIIAITGASGATIGAKIAETLHNKKIETHVVVSEGAKVVLKHETKNAEEVLDKLKSAGVGGLLVMGGTSEPVCEIGVELNRIGAILFNGLNPVACAVEAGIEAESHGMSTVMEYQRLIKFNEL